MPKTNQKARELAAELVEGGMNRKAKIGDIAKRNGIPPATLNDAVAHIFGMPVGRQLQSRTTKGRTAEITATLRETYREKHGRKPKVEAGPVTREYAIRDGGRDHQAAWWLEHPVTDDNPFTADVFNWMAGEIIRLRGELDRTYALVQKNGKEALSSEFWKVYDDYKVRA
jgi:hypothetical protein